MADDNEVQIKKNRRMLEEIRGTTTKEDENNVKYEQSGSGVGVRNAENRNRVDEPTTTGNAGTARPDTRGPSGNTKTERPTKRTDKGTGPTNGPGVNTAKSNGTNNGRPEAIAEKTGGFRFNWKGIGGNKQKEPVRLFTKEEAEESYDRMYAVYFQGSGLLDDLLEIIVKDHEPVTIWQMSPEEAENFASIHLSRAQVDKEAARSARKLLEIYDRLYRYLYVLPRGRRTYEHVKEHGGFSFK